MCLTLAFCSKRKITGRIYEAPDIVFIDLLQKGRSYRAKYKHTTRSFFLLVFIITVVSIMNISLNYYGHQRSLGATPSCSKSHAARLEFRGAAC